MAAPRVLNPRLVPVVGTDSHLPAVDPQRLTADAVRQRFAQLSDWQTEHHGDGRAFTERTPSQAAVLVPLVQRPDGLQVLLTRRTDHLRDHAGQISFPGGRAEALRPLGSGQLLAAPFACSAQKRRTRRTPLRGRLTASGQLLFDARRLATALTQVVQLGAAHVAAALEFDAGYQRRVGLKRTFHPFT